MLDYSLSIDLINVVVIYICIPRIRSYYVKNNTYNFYTEEASCSTYEQLALN